MNWRLVKLEKGWWRMISDFEGCSMDFVLSDIFERPIRDDPAG